MHHNHSILLLRKNYNLSQGDLAHLIGISQSALCRMEDGQVGNLQFDVVLALAVIFGESLNRMFPKRYAKIEEAVMNRAADMYQATEGRSDSKMLIRRELFEQMMRRATANRQAI